MLSVIIPSKDDPYLVKTINEILIKAKGDVEVLVNIDGREPQDLPQDDRVTYTRSSSAGMRAGVNAGIRRAKGEYIMKTDSHCMFADGFDTTIIQDANENWLIVPRRYPLDVERWDIDEKRGIRDYQYLSFPENTRSYGLGMFPVNWTERTRDRLGDPRYIIDDTMIIQGSCWVANRKYFMDKIGLMDDRVETYGGFADEPLEIGLKYWLGGGEVKVNKKTYYAHYHPNADYYLRNKIKAEYKRSKDTQKSHTWGTKHWINNEEPNMTHPFEWLVEKFWPIPGWDVEWKERWKKLNE